MMNDDLTVIDGSFNHHICSIHTANLSLSEGPYLVVVISGRFFKLGLLLYRELTFPSPKEPSLSRVPCGHAGISNYLKSNLPRLISFRSVFPCVL